jgi:hypothetical protein
MELAERIDSINKQLRDEFGLESSINEPMFRVVFSDDQREMRLGDYNDFTPSGLFIRSVREVREVPKYQWIKARWVLEQLSVVPEVNMLELPTVKLSYEPLWIFENQSGDYLPPRYDAAKLIVDTMLAVKGKTSLRKYVDSEANTTTEGRQNEITKLQQELFGNETPATDALAHKTGVVVPHSYGDNK